MKIFSDSADFESLVKLSKIPLVEGFTTNPTLMRAAGVKNYEKFSRDSINFLNKNRPDTCISLEVFADESLEIEKQARIIDSWSDGFNVYVKVPIMTTQGISNKDVIHSLIKDGVKVNVTAVFTERQVVDLLRDAPTWPDLIISVFAGRIADTKRDPEVTMENIKSYIETTSSIQLLWASTREIFNYTQAYRSRCDIITMTPDQIQKMIHLDKKSLELYSRETVKMFFDDAKMSNYTIEENNV